MNKRPRSKLFNLTALILVLSLALPWSAFASGVDVSVVDVLAPIGSVTLTPGGASGPITINLSVSGNQDGTATFTVNRSWVLSGGAFTGSNPQTFTVPARNGSDPATTFSTTGSVSVASGQGTGTFNLAVGVFSITNSNSTGAKLAAGSSINYAVTVSAPTPTTTTVSCPASVTYTGAAQTPCTATVTGAGGLNQSLTVSYSNNSNAGTATASASFAGNSTYAASSDSQTFTIAKAPSTVSVNCSNVTYTGAAQTPCTAAYSGVGGLSGTLTPTYSNNTNAGTATASASYAGDANHTSSNNSATFAIALAPSTTSVTCSGGVTYTGAAQTPCTAAYSGVGGLSGTLTPTYSNNTNAGTATASASYAGDANHSGSSDSATFTIASAASQTDVTCPTTSVDYTGAAIEPCAATATGAGGLNQSLTVSYSDNINAGTATASASYAGDANHTNSSNSTTFQIGSVGSNTTINCPASVTYNASAQTPCTAIVTGVGGLNQSVTVVYTSNTNAGTATATATFAGDGNHDGSSAQTTFTIAKANATINVSGYTGVYDGNAHGATGSAIGIGGESAGTLNLGDSFTNVPGGTASWTFTGNGNYNDASGDAPIVITKAASTTTISCPASVVYTGAAQTPCSATATGAGGLNAPVAVDYSNNTNAGTASVTATFAEDTNHSSSNDTASFTIDQASSTVALTCPPSVTYDGNAQTPCSAKATGAGGLDASVTVIYDNNTNAGTASAVASYPGDANHIGSINSTTFTISKADATISVIGYTGAYDGNTHGATGSAKGVKDELLTGLSLGDSFTNVPGGQASWSFTDSTGNYNDASGTVNIVITKAASTVTVTCNAGPFTYTGAAHTPCSATYSGAGGLGGSLMVSYSDNVNSGTATATASYAGDANHEASTGSATFTIAKAASTVSVTCAAGPFIYTGSPFTPCTANVTGAGGLNQVLPVNYSNNINPSTATAPATATATYAGDANHKDSTGSATFTINSWTLKGFYQPVDMGNTVNTVKNGSTVPLKFEVFAGATELMDVSVVKTFTQTKIACTTGAEDAIEEIASTGGTTLRYDTTGGQFIQNWKTPSGAGTCYKVTMTTQDGSSMSALFKLK